MSEELPRLMFVLLPVFALFLKIAVPARLYFDHLIFSVHLHSAAYIVLALVLALEFAEDVVADITQLLFYAFLFGYLVISIARVYDKRWPMAALISFGVLVIYLLSISVVIEAGSNLQILSD